MALCLPVLLLGAGLLWWGARGEEGEPVPGDSPPVAPPPEAGRTARLPGLPSRVPVPPPAAPPDGTSAAEEPVPAGPDAVEKGGAGEDEDAPVIKDVNVPNHGEDVVLARVDEDEPGGGPVAVAPGRAPPREIEGLVREGLDSVRGTVEVAGKRRASVETGVPVALTGRVLEKETGRPVAGAAVVLRSAFYLRRIFYDHQLKEVARAVTNADGEYRIERLNVDPVHFGEGGRVYLSVSSPDHAPLPALPLDDVAPGWRNRLADLHISKESFTVRGRVIDRWEGKPVVGARVVATGKILPIQFPKDQREALFLSSPETKTDDEGRFVLENVGRGPQTISVHGGDDCAGYLEVQVPAKAEVVISARALRGRIEGRVLDERGRPVDVVKIDGGDNSTHTFGDGSFVLETFRGDVVTLLFSHPEYRTHSLPGVKNGSREVDVRLTSRLPEVKIRARDHRTGKPLSPISVTFAFPEGAGEPVPGSPFYLSEEGLHAVRLPSGAIRATVAAAGREPREVDVTGLRDGDVVELMLR